MVPEKPPRRSKADKEPITIDLPTEPSNPVAEPVRSNDSDIAVSAEPADQVVATEAARPQDDIIDQPVTAPLTAHEPISDEASADAHPVGEPPIDELPIDGPRTDEPTPALASDPEPAFVQQAGSEPASTEREHRPASNVPDRQSPSSTALLASGIVGGLVALALAGSMQYAGYLPAVSANRTEDAATLPPEIETLAPEVAALRQQVQALQNRPAPVVDSSLAERVQALESGLSQAAQTDVPQRLAAIENQIADVRSVTQATAGNDQTLTRRLEEAEAKINDTGPEQQVARAVAAAALKAAIDRGGPFETELQTFAGVAGDDPAVAELQKFGSAGVPSRAQLQGEFPRVADTMLEAAARPDENQGLGGRLLSSAMSVVKVRRVGDVQGNTPEAIVARMEEGLRNGDLAASARQWDSLPEPAKAASQDFKQKLDARIQVENLVGGTLTRAVAGTQG